MYINLKNGILTLDNKPADDAMHIDESTLMANFANNVLGIYAAQNMGKYTDADIQYLKTERKSGEV